MRRGDIAIGASDGDYGKPRPVLIIQTDALNETHGSIVVCPITSQCTGMSYRIALGVSASTGLHQPSEVMIDKVQAVRREKLRDVVGRIDPVDLDRVERVLTVVLGLGER